jgi:hypothetical protein
MDRYRNQLNKENTSLNNQLTKKTKVIHRLEKDLDDLQAEVLVFKKRDQKRDD